MSLGAMGAGQWTGRWRTRPHALLDVRGYGDVDEWAKSLPRGARRTRAKSLAQNFTVTSKVIDGDAPAPHSSLAHFRCVVEHEARLLAKSPDAFFEALQVAISRYMGTTQQAGVIREYRDAETGRVLAFAHEVQKGRCMRGQWFYGTDAASKRYVWFHSVHEVVRRAIGSDGIDHADLGPSGSDSFTELKERCSRASRTGTSSTTAAAFGTATSSRSFCGRFLETKSHLKPSHCVRFAHPSSRFNRLIAHRCT